MEFYERWDVVPFPISSRGVPQLPTDHSAQVPTEALPTAPQQEEGSSVLRGHWTRKGQSCWDL